MYKKRQMAPRYWPIPRKGTAYVAVPSHNHGEGVPLVIFMRDVLSLVRNEKELKRALREKQILINNVVIHDPTYPVCLFDVVSILPLKKHYRASLSTTHRMILEEISEKEAQTRVYRVMNTKTIRGGKTQVHLMHGRTFLFDKPLKTGDSLVINTDKKEVIAVLPLEKGKKVFISRGRNAGKNGTINALHSIGGKPLAEIIIDKEKVNVWTKNIVVVA